MKTTIKKELISHIMDCINDRVINDENRDDWHYHCFNEDYYIIGYYQAGEWLKSHNLGEFESMTIVQEYELENFGETRVYDNAESVVNMLAYIYGEEILSSCISDNVKDLETELNELS